MTKKQKQTKKQFKFKGWCYIEIGQYFNLDIDDNCDDSEKNLKIIREYIEGFYGKSHEKEIADAIRSYIKAMLKYREIDNFAPVYDGMLKMTNDECLIKATSALLSHMWT